jgi:hypothetical protein
MLIEVQKEIRRNLYKFPFKNNIINVFVLLVRDEKNEYLFLEISRCEFNELLTKTTTLFTVQFQNIFTNKKNIYMKERRK